jgi:hypothetical protein
MPAIMQLPSLETSTTTTFYLAYNLTETARDQLLCQFPPRYQRVIAHHITFDYGVAPDSDLPPMPHRAQVIGYACDEAIEALVVEINGSIHRPDGAIFHVTLSLEPELRRPVDSNALLAGGWQACPPYPLEITPALND